MPIREQQDNELYNMPIGGFNSVQQQPEIQSNPLANFSAVLSKGYGINYALNQSVAPGGKTGKDVFLGGLRQFNTLGSIVGRQPGMPAIYQKPSAGFDPFQFIPQDKQGFANRYINANSEGEVDAISRQIDQERNDREALGGSGWLGGLAGVAAGILDPINLIPFGNAAHGAQAGNILQGAARGALHGLGFAALQESGLQATQLTRELGSSADNIAGITLLSGLIGGLAPAARLAWGGAKSAFSKVIEGQLAAKIENDLKLPRQGRYQPSEIEPVLRAYDQASSELENAKALHPEDSPEVIYAKNQKKLAKENWEEAVSKTAEPDIVEPGGVEISPQALETDTGVAAAHSAEGPITQGIAESPKFEPVDWLGLGEQAVTQAAKPLSKTALQKQIRERISDLVGQFASKDLMLGEQPATDFLSQYDIKYKKAPKIGDGTGFQLFVPKKGYIAFPQGASLNALVERIGIPGLAAKLQKNEGTIAALEKHLQEVQQSAMGEHSTDISSELASVDVAAQEGKGQQQFAQRESEENAHLHYINNLANDILERFHRVDSPEAYQAALDYSLEHDSALDVMPEEFYNRYNEELRKANERAHPTETANIDPGTGNPVESAPSGNAELGEMGQAEPEGHPQGRDGGNAYWAEWGEHEGSDESAWEDGDNAFETADDGTIYADAPIDDSATANELLKDHGFLKKLPLLNQQDPLIRTLLSPSLETRRIIQTLAEVPLRYAKNALGVATKVPIESIIKQSKAPLAYALKEMDDLFERYRFGQAGKFGKLRAEAGDALGQGGDLLTYDEFKREIGRAMRNGDKHPIPEVAQAASSFREKVFNPLKERAINIGALAEDVKQLNLDGSNGDIGSYLSRVWDIEKIIAKRDDFFNLNLEYLMSKETGGRPREALELIADRLIDRIIGAPNGRLEYNLVYKDPATGAISDIASMAGGSGGGTGRVRHSSPLHAQIYDIPDAWVEEFLISDIEHVAKKYERTMSADISLMEGLKTPDLTIGLEQLRSRIAGDWDLKMRGLNDESQLKKLEKLKRRDLRDVEAVFDRLRGTYGLPEDPSSVFVRGGKIMRTYNYLTLMGGVAMSSIPGLAGPVLVHGATRFLRDGLVPLISDFKGFRLAAEEVKLAGAGLEMILDSRMMAIGELMDDYGRGSQLERGLSFLQEGFGKVTGISQWTASLKQLAGMMTQTRLLQAIKQTVEGGVSAKELENLAASYIDENMAHRIYEQFSQHGRTQGNIHLPNTNAWEDQLALQTFRSAILKDVDRIIVTPGQDKPLFLSTEMGKLFGQFKSFAFAGTQRVLMTGIQNRDLATLNGVVFATSLGVLVTLMKARMSGREIDMRPQSLIAEGVDRAGLTGWLFDANNILEKATRGHVGISRVLGKQPNTRYASRNLTDALAGPTAGKISDASKILTGISRAILPGEDEEGKPAWQSADTRAVRRLIPFQNLFFIRGLFDRAEDGLNAIMGVDPEEREAKTE